MRGATGMVSGDCTSAAAAMATAAKAAAEAAAVATWWPVAARVGAGSPPAVVECWFSCGSAWVMVQLAVT